MKRHQVPALALTLSVPLLGVLWIAGKPATEGQDAALMVPLLAMLIFSEFGLILNSVGVAAGVLHGLRQGWTGRHALMTTGCALAALAFLLQLIRWWPL